MNISRDKLHTFGRVFTVLGILLMYLVPVMIWIITGIGPDWNQFIIALVGLSVLYLPGGIIEMITYGPILGTSGTYLAFITGNLINLKIPCVMNARELVGTEINTEENEVISTLAVAFSSITTVIIMSLGVILLIPLRPLLNSEVLAPAFNWVVSALFGALGFKYFRGNFKLAIVPLTLVVILSLIMPKFVYENVVILIVILAIITIVVARVFFEREKKKEVESE